MENLDNYFGYILGTIKKKPCKLMPKTHQNDTFSTEKTIKNMIYSLPEKEFE